MDGILSFAYGRPLHFGESVLHGLLGKATLPTGQLDLLSKVQVQEPLEHSHTQGSKN